MLLPFFRNLQLLRWECIVLFPQRFGHQNRDRPVNIDMILRPCSLPCQGVINLFWKWSVWLRTTTTWWPICCYWHFSAVTWSLFWQWSWDPVKTRREKKDNMFGQMGDPPVGHTHTDGPRVSMLWDDPLSLEKLQQHWLSGPGALLFDGHTGTMSYLCVICKMTTSVVWVSVLSLDMCKVSTISVR